MLFLEPAGTFSSGPTLEPLSVMKVNWTSAEMSPRFCTSTQVSNPPCPSLSVQPSARYQLYEAAGGVCSVNCRELELPCGVTTKTSPLVASRGTCTTMLESVHDSLAATSTPVKET